MCVRAPRKSAHNLSRHSRNVWATSTDPTSGVLVFFFRVFYKIGVPGAGTPENPKSEPGYPVRVTNRRRGVQKAGHVCTQPLQTNSRPKQPPTALSTCVCAPHPASIWHRKIGANKCKKNRRVVCVCVSCHHYTVCATASTTPTTCMQHQRTPGIHPRYNTQLLYGVPATPAVGTSQNSKRACVEPVRAQRMRHRHLCHNRHARNGCATATKKKLEYAIGIPTNDTRKRDNNQYKKNKKKRCLVGVSRCRGSRVRLLMFLVVVLLVVTSVVKPLRWQCPVV
jgi:hypothetical protein